MKPYVLVHDGIYKTIARKGDGKSIADAHADGECLRDCPFCKRGE